MMTPKILLVDDEPNILKALARLIRRSGFEVFTACSAEEGIAIQLQQQCPLIISDFRMPEQNGAEFLARVKTISPNTISMILSGYADFDSVLAILNSGVAFKFLQKPWSDTELLADIAQAWQLYQDRQHNDLHTSLLIGSKDALLELNTAGVILRANAQTCDILGVSSQELVGSHLQQHLPNLGAAQLHDLYGQTQLSINTQTQFHAEVEVIYQAHHHDCLLLRLVTMRPATPLLHEPDAQHLYTREQLMLTLQQNLKTQAHPCALIYLDVVNFDDIHQSIGFSAIDELLALLCVRMPQMFAQDAMVASLYADQFAILLPKITNEAMVLRKLEQMVAKFAEPIQLSRCTVHVRFRIGYALAPADGQEAQLLLDYARQAAGISGNVPGVMAQRYDQTYINDRRRQYEISNALYDPSVCQHFSLHYQPKIRLADGTIDGAEILLRWQHQQLGWISPALFIPIAERDGQIQKIGYWVLQQCLKQLELWLQAGFQPVKLSVNVSAAQLMRPDFVSEVSQLLLQFNIPKHCLEFELTETVAFHDLEHCSELMTQLKALGIQLAIDDFGSGYASLSYLNQLPVDVVKLDRSLLIDLETSLSCQSIIRNMIRMIRELGIVVVAEGIESEAQVEILRQMKCDYVQGYVFSKPIALERCEDMLRQQPFTAQPLHKDFECQPK